MSKIIFKDGIPGFEEYKNYQIEINEDDENPFNILQSLDDEELSFIIIDPFTINPNYDFNLTESTVEKLEINEPIDVSVYTIVTIPDGDYQSMTTNLLAPIIVNTKNKQAKQIILNETQYSTKHKIIASGE